MSISYAACLFLAELCPCMQNAFAVEKSSQVTGRVGSRGSLRSGKKYNLSSSLCSWKQPDRQTGSLRHKYIHKNKISAKKGKPFVCYTEKLVYRCPGPVLQLIQYGVLLQVALSTVPDEPVRYWYQLTQPGWLGDFVVPGNHWTNSEVPDISSSKALLHEILKILFQDVVEYCKFEDAR